ncbi:MAG: quinone-dependent dihydroorotate dehydrogenase [Rhodospirillales bacterium]
MDAYSLTWPLVRKLSPEVAHNLALWALGRRLVSGSPYADPVLETTLWGRRFRNPVGLAAGFDKDAAVPMQALALGFGFVEIGSVTPRPQPGNPKPRLFRLDQDDAVINRMGFNSKGADHAQARLADLPASRSTGVIGVNLGKNKETTDAAADYVIGIEKLARHADYVVVNVSSPNTPGLRALQDRAELEKLIGHVRTALDKACPDATPPLLVKVAPDLTDADITDIAAVATSGAVDGLIATNTTITRPENLHDAQKSETGGLSGRPLTKLSTRVIGDFYRATSGKVPLIGVGGICSGADAYDKIRAGASLVQVYSGMVFEGPALPGRICRALAGLLKRDGFAHLSDAVGADHK